MTIIEDYPMYQQSPPKRRLVLAGKYGKRLRQIKEQADMKREAFHSDAGGNPSERLCSPELLRRIREARDEQEARELRAVKR